MLRALITVFIQHPHHIVLFIEVTGFGNKGLTEAVMISTVTQAVCCRVFWGKNVENRSGFGDITCQSILTTFF